MKKMNFKKAVSSNKGNATYYVLAVIMIITIMVSGLLTVSLRSSIVSMNYANDIESYNKCDSVLQKIKGELSAALVGETVTGGDVAQWFVDNTSVAKKIVHPYGPSNTQYCYPVKTDTDEVGYRAEKYLTAQELELVKSNEIVSGRVYGFIIKRPENANYIIIEGILVESEGVGISTDVKLVMDNAYKITDVVFENYRIITVTETGGDG